MKALILISSLSLLAAKADLKVMSYNIRHGAGMDGKLDLERTARVIKQQKPDLLALQEVDMDCKRSGAIKQADFLANTLGDYQPAFGSFMNYDGGQYGLAIVSKYPIKKSIVHQLPKGVEPRVALEVQVRVPKADGKSELISFVCVHFDYVKDDKARFAQAQTLIQELETRQHPVIITGDFNDTRESRTLKAFAETYTLPASAGATFSAKDPTKEIDFCVYRGLGKLKNYQVLNERKASDHLPLIATFADSE